MDNGTQTEILEARFRASIDSYVASRDDTKPIDRPAPHVAHSDDMAGRLGDVETFRRFVRGGNATFTVRNVASGNRLTFKVSKPKEGNGPASFFVGVLNGPDNESSYAYMGMIKNTVAGEFFTLTKNSKVTRDAASYRAFEAIWRMAESQRRLPQGLEIWHAGCCGRCGRKLTVPESIESGFGPECVKKVA